MKRLLILFIILSAISPIRMFSQGLSTAKNYGESMKQWSVTENDRYRRIIERICDGKKSTRIADEIAMDLAYKNGYQDNVSYMLDSYLNWIDKAIQKGISIEFSDFNVVNRDKIEGSTYQETKYAQEYDKDYVSCRIKIHGALSYDVYDLICMRNGKITKISKYEKSGNRVKVDFSDLVSEHSVEVSYGYSSNYPLNLSIHTNFAYFNIGIEYGQNFSNKPFHFVKHTNFATSKVDSKYYYLLATPGVYLRYASIDCGLGGVFTKYNYESVYSSYDEKNTYFMVKPKATFHIPVPFGRSHREERLYISPHIAYQYVPKFSMLNCWEFGIGVRIRFETY